MRLADLVNDDYLTWMYELVCGDRFHRGISFRKLFRHLYNTEFTYSIPMDENRAVDGVGLRYRFALHYVSMPDADEYIYGACSVLEMMIALAGKIEETLDDPLYGERTAQWFWNMIVSLGLGSMNDKNYDEAYVQEVLDIFLNREYEPDGKGGLFTIRGCREDLRDADIWYQSLRYMDTIV